MLPARTLLRTLPTSKKSAQNVVNESAQEEAEDNDEEMADTGVTKIENIAGKLNLGVLPKLLRALVHVWLVVVCH